MLQFDNPRPASNGATGSAQAGGVVEFVGTFDALHRSDVGERPRETKIEYGPLHHTLHVVSMCCGS